MKALRLHAHEVSCAWNQSQRWRPQEGRRSPCTTPRVPASGGKTRFGPLRSDVNRYLKWAFVEAATVVCRHRRRHPHRHVSHLYERLARRKGHQKAIGAVARHLAEATYWMLTKGEPYREPRLALTGPPTLGLVHGGVSAVSD